MKNGTNGHALKIEKGIPMPKNHGNSRGYAEAMRSMKAGDSIVLPVKTYSGAWQHACTHLGKGNFVVRLDGGGYRVWKTK